MTSGFKASILRWSTDEVREAERLDYFAATLRESVIPLSIDAADPLAFDATLRVAQFNGIAVSKIIASPHTAFRGRSEIARTRDHRFNLSMALDCLWTVDHHGPLRLSAGDLLMHDSSYPVSLDVRVKSTGINLSMDEAWLRRWIPNPGVLVGNRLVKQSGWVGALASFLRELSPDLFAAPPLPLTVLSDQLGALLALAASDYVRLPAHTSATRSLQQLIVDCIVQRCSEQQLTAADVAQSLRVSVRTLHRTLGSSAQTFGQCLIKARGDQAIRMLQSQSFKRVTLSEISRRAGFSSPSHFARVVRQRVGLTPRQLRQAACP